MARNILGVLLLVGLTAYGANAQSFANFSDFISSYNGADLTVFKAALDKSGLASALDSINGTVFIPNNAAFASFATSLGLANANALLDLSQDVVAALLKFHVVPAIKVNLTTPAVLAGADLANASTASALYSSLTTLATPVARVSLNLTTNITDVKSSTIKSPRATAKFVSTSADPFVSVGTARAAVISEVLGYWYQNIASAIDDHSRLGLLKRSLVNNGMWSELSNPNLNRTVFAPTDAGVTGVNKDFKINVQINSSVAQELLTYMQSYGAQVTNFSADVSAAYNYTSLFLNSSSIVANQTGANKVAVSSIGSITKVGDYATFQIGGPTPKSFLYVVNYPLIPKATNIWELIKDEPSLSTLVGLFLREGNEYKKLAAITADGETTASSLAYTLMAPNNAAFVKFASTYGTVPNVANLTDLIGASSLAAFLRNHIVVGSYATGNLTAGVQLNTLQNSGYKKLVVTTSGSSIILAAEKTLGTLVYPFNTVVAYGWSYIQTVDFPLVPEAVNLPNPNSAGAALPSVLVLLMGLLAALMMI